MGHIDGKKSKIDIQADRFDPSDKEDKIFDKNKKAVYTAFTMDFSNLKVFYSHRSYSDLEGDIYNVEKKCWYLLERFTFGL